MEFFTQQGDIEQFFKDFFELGITRGKLVTENIQQGKIDIIDPMIIRRNRERLDITAVVIEQVKSKMPLKLIRGVHGSIDWNMIDDQR